MSTAERRQVLRGDGAWVAGEDDQVGQLAGGDGAFELLLEGGERAVAGEHAQRFVDGDALLRAHALAGLRSAG